MNGVTKHKRWIASIRPKLAHEYHVRNRTLDDISQEYNISQSAIRTAKDLYSRKEAINIFGNRKAFLILNNRDIEEAYKALKELGYNVELANKDSILEERYESKINNYGL